MNQTNTQVPSSFWWPRVRASIIAGTSLTDICAFDERTPTDIRRGAVALLAGQPDHIWEAAARDTGVAAAAVARRPDIPDHVALLLAAHPEPMVATRLGANRNITFEALELVRTQRRHTFWQPAVKAVAANPVWGAEALRGPLVTGDPIRELVGRVLDDSVDCETHMWPALRWLASNPTVPAATLTAVTQQLCASSNADSLHGVRVVDELIRNPQLPTEALDLLEPHAGRQRVRVHPNCRVELVVEALNSNYRFEALSHPKLPAETVERCVADGDHAVAANPSLAVEQIHRLRAQAGDRLSRVDGLLGSNPATPHELLVELAANGTQSAVARLAARGHWAGVRYTPLTQGRGHQIHVVTDGPDIDAGNVDALCALAVTNGAAKFGQLLELAQLI